MRILAKIGGAQLEDAASRDQLCRAIASAVNAGHEVALVHGGGNQIRQLSARLGIEDHYHDGLRVTDAETAEVVVMVLAGSVNRTLAHSLTQADVPALGLCGADAGVFTAKKLERGGADLGYVGEVHAVRTEVLERLLESGIVPVLATVAPLDGSLDGDRSHFYNINADQAAAPLARALQADAMLFLTDVPGVLEEGARIETLDAAACRSLRERGVIAGGMIPKVEAALGAAEANPNALVKIAPAAGDDAVLAALDPDVGTRFTAEGAVHG